MLLNEQQHVTIAEHIFFLNFGFHLGILQEAR